MLVTALGAVCLAGRRIVDKRPAVPGIEAELTVSSPTDSQISPLIPPNAKHLTASIFSGAGTGLSIELRRAVTLVGSRPGCKITLRHGDISPVHCAIINMGEEVYLRDLMSKKGTYLNGLRAECEKLSHGDVIAVGEWEIAVDVQAPKLGDPTGSSAINLEPAPSMVALKKNQDGPLVKLRREVNLISRKSGADFVLHDSRVSRAHALIFILNGRPVVCDLLSENGLLLNGQATHFGVIHSGDTLTLGSSEVRVVIPSPTVSAAPSKNGSAALAETTVKGDNDASDLIDIRAAEVHRD